MIKKGILLMLSIVWIAITSFKFFPINSIGGLLTFGTGVMSIPLETSSDKKIVVKDDINSYIRIDSFGIPHIYGKKEKDLAYSLGYMHAKDRYFQMELISRITEGKLSEFVGESGIYSDIFWKPYELDTKAKVVLQELQNTDPDFFNFIKAYTKGVNQFVKYEKVNDPLYNIFDRKPRLWKMKYCLMINYYLSKNLSYFQNNDLVTQRLLDNLPSDARKMLYPRNPDSLKTIIPQANMTKKIDRILGSNISRKNNLSDSSINFMLQEQGSNNWVLNNSKTKDGSTILANDPHLLLTLPGFFYEAHVDSPTLKVYGFTIPGVPLFITGFNKKISWGITNGEWDITNTFKLNVKDDSLYYYNQNWVPFIKREYNFEVRGFGRKKFSKLFTKLGIVEKVGGEYYAVNWHGGKKSYSSQAYYNLMKANDWKDFKTALEDFDYPPQNFVFGDVNNNIGVYCAGKLPLRPKDYVGGVIKKFPISDSRTEHSTEEIFALNPKRGFFFSANQQPIQNNKYYGSNWSKDDYRVERIYQLLINNNNWDLQSVKRMQTDITDRSIHDVLKLLRSFPEISKKYSYIEKRLSNWDAKLAPKKIESLIFNSILESISLESDSFAKEYLNVRKKPSNKFFIAYLVNKDSKIQNTPNKKVLVENILANTDTIFREKKRRSLSHKEVTIIPNISNLPVLNTKIEAIGGNNNTINLNSNGVYPAFRAIFVLKNDSIKGETIMAGGQSGKINSKNYKDQIKIWRNGFYKEIQSSSSPEALKDIEYNIILTK